MSCSHCRAGSVAEVCVCQAGARTRSGQVQGPSAGPQLMLPALIKFWGFVWPCLVTLAGYEDSVCRDLPIRDVMNMVLLLQITCPLFILMGKGLLHAPLNPVLEACFYWASLFFLSLSLSLFIYLSATPSITTEACSYNRGYFKSRY